MWPIESGSNLHMILLLSISESLAYQCWERWCLHHVVLYLYSRESLAEFPVFDDRPLLSSWCAFHATWHVSAEHQFHKDDATLLIHHENSWDIIMCNNDYHWLSLYILYIIVIHSAPDGFSRYLSNQQRPATWGCCSRCIDLLCRNHLGSHLGHVLTTRDTSPDFIRTIGTFLVDGRWGDVPRRGTLNRRFESLRSFSRHLLKWNLRKEPAPWRLIGEGTSCHWFEVDLFKSERHYMILQYITIYYMSGNLNLIL